MTRTLRRNYCVEIPLREMMKYSFISVISKMYSPHIHYRVNGGTNIYILKLQIDVSYRTFVQPSVQLQFVYEWNRTAS